MKEYYEYAEAFAHDPLTRFQILLEGHNGAGRYLKYNKEANKISGYALIPSGSKFKIGYTAPTKCVQRCYEICNEMSETPIEDLFVYSCIFRKVNYGNSAKWELSPFHNYNVCGAFLLGEIAHINGKNEHLNGTCVLSGVAEKENYVVPDLTVFKHLYNIENENNKILNFVLQKQNQIISSQNKSLLENLMRQQKAIKEQLYMDPNIGIGNLIKYQEDVKKYNFDKLCLIRIDNMDALTVYLGHDLYHSSVKTQFHVIKEHVYSRGHATHIHVYAVNSDTFVIASNAEIDDVCFVEITKDIYTNFQFIPIPNTAIPIINRFVVSVNDSISEGNLLETTYNTLCSNGHLQHQYIVCDKNSNQKSSSYNELKMLTILNHALENDRIVPYYQGIYDNKKNQITRYEALMRIIDEDGTVYTPDRFMDIAKKYHMYELISWCMIECVFKDFGNKDTTGKSISINLSAYDINRKTFRKKLFSKLSNLRNASSFVFEILEDEEFRDLAVLREFVSEVRKYDVKIAIDDFGSGYSNLLEVVKIAPEYIKIDGGIIRNVCNDAKSSLVLETIVYLAKKIGSSVTAEYVEDIHIYEHVKSADVDYSQGYYFAKPVPIDQLN